VRRQEVFAASAWVLVPPHGEVQVLTEGSSPTESFLCSGRRSGAAHLPSPSAFVTPVGRFVCVCLRCSQVGVRVAGGLVVVLTAG